MADSTAAITDAADTWGMVMLAVAMLAVLFAGTLGTPLVALGVFTVEAASAVSMGAAAGAKQTLLWWIDGFRLIAEGHFSCVLIE